MMKSSCNWLSALQSLVYRSAQSGTALPRRSLLWLFALGLLSACGGGGDSSNSSSFSTAPDNTSALSADLSGQLSSTIAKTGGVMELTISGLGTNNATAQTRWINSPGFAVSSNSNSNASPANKNLAGVVPLPNFLDVAPLVSSTIDSGGFRYIAATVRVRNASSCAFRGSCPAYSNARQNVTFFAVNMPGTINQTAVSRFKRFDGSDANPLLTAELLPAHGLNAFGNAVDPNLASFNAYRESEVPAADTGVTSVLPYGFVVRNVNDGSRTLPANPAVDQFDGVVTFGFRIPLQANPTDDPFKISMRFQTADDTNARVTQSMREQDFSGDLTAAARATSLGGNDLVVLGRRLALTSSEPPLSLPFRVSQTTIGDPICRVRIAGTAAAPTAYLNDYFSFTPALAAAPFNLSFVDRTSEVSLGFCENMDAPSAANFFVRGSQSGLRKAGSAYAGTLMGGGASNRPNQLVWNIAGEKPFFPGEEVSYVATAAISSPTAGALPTPIVGSFRVRGSSPGSGNFAAAVDLQAGSDIVNLRLGDINGDGRLDIVALNLNQSTVTYRLGLNVGFAAPVSFVVDAYLSALEIGDMDNDGKLDLVLVNSLRGKVSVVYGDGAGGFSAPTDIPVGNGPGTAALGDVNGDGRLDILVPVSSAGAIAVILGGGAIGFQTPVNYLVGASPSSVALGDLNGDGVLDAVVTNATSSNVSVLIGNANGNGTFAAASNFAVGTNPRSAKLGDFNGDGKLDLVVVNAGGNSLSVLLGDGAGGLTAATDLTVGAFPTSVAIGDFDGDGKLDLAATTSIVYSLAVLKGNGSGGFSAPVDYAVGNNPQTVATGDVNNDGKLDLVVANYGTSFNLPPNILPASISVLQGL